MNALASAPTLSAAIDDFERGDVDPARFSHEAHVRMAWSYLCEFGLFDGMCRFAGALQRLTIRIGAEDKYHATITGFFMLLIAERMALAPESDWPAFKRNNADLLRSFRQLLQSHYSKSRLASPLARRQLLLPDRTPPPRSPVNCGDRRHRSRPSRSRRASR